MAVPSVVVVHQSLPVKNMAELGSSLKSRPGSISYASAGNGAVNHLAGEWFKSETRINALHVPYKGDSAAVSDLIAGRVDFAFLAGVVAIPQDAAGKMRILASAGSSPYKSLKGTLVIGQDKLPGFSAEPWNGLMGPAGIAPDIVARLNTALNEIMNAPDVKARLLTLDQYPFTRTPEQFKAHIQQQSANWAAIIKSANIVLE